MKALSLDLRERIVAALVEGGSVQEVAERFCVSHDSVRLIGSLQVPSTKGLATGSYQLQLPRGQKGTILVHDVRPKRITFVVFGELK